jgi:hypothetical protein
VDFVARFLQRRFAPADEEESRTQLRKAHRHRPAESRPAAGKKNCLALQ